MKFISILFFSIIYKFSVAQWNGSHIKIDSAQNHYLQYRNSTSFYLKITYLKKAIQFFPADSFYLFVANEYLALGGCTEALRYANYALKSPIQTGIYSDQALSQYLTSLTLLGRYKEAFQILEKNKNDTVFFKGLRIRRNEVNIEIQSMHQRLNMLADSVSVWEQIPNRTENNYSLTAQYYFELGKRAKAYRELRLGLKKYKQSGTIYFFKGRLSLWAGKYAEAVINFNKSTKLSAPNAQYFREAAQFLKDTR
jgi:tetratricopeptide (TPR) repeat protein